MNDIQSVFLNFFKPNIFQIQSANADSMAVPSLVVAHSPIVGGSSGGALVSGLRQASVLLGADPQHGDDERVAEAHHHDRKRKQNDQLVPGERDAFEVAVEIRVGARHEHHVSFVVVVQHVPRVLRFIHHAYHLTLLLQCNISRHVATRLSENPGILW